MKRHTIIYITGLSDQNPRFQKFAIKTWRIYRVEPVFFQTGWGEASSFSEKLSRLVDLIDTQHKAGKTVSLVGVSAGASLVVAAYAKRKTTVHKVVFICGKLRRPEAVGEAYYRNNPAFRDAMKYLNSNLDKLGNQERARIVSLSPLFDEIVAKKDTFVKNAKNITLPTLFHAYTIAVAITFLSPLIMMFFKNEGELR